MSMLKGDPPISEEEKERILKTIYTEGGMRDLLPLAKLEHPHLKLVYSSPLKNVGLNLAKGIKAHQAGRSEWIRQKKWKLHWTTLEYDEVGKGSRLFEVGMCGELGFCRSPPPEGGGLELKGTEPG